MLNILTLLVPFPFLGRLLRVDLITLEGEMSVRMQVRPYVRPQKVFFRYQ